MCISKMIIDINQARLGRGGVEMETRGDLVSAGNDTRVRFNKKKLF